MDFHCSVIYLRHLLSHKCKAEYDSEWSNRLGGLETMFANIKVIVFDLDGTLYEDTHHFDYYAKRIEEKLPKEKRQAFRNDYRAVLSGQHPLKIGRIYDTENDFILTLKDNFVENAYRWDGTKLE